MLNRGTNNHSWASERAREGVHSAFLLLTSGQGQGGFDLTLRTGCHFGDSNTRLR